MKPAIKPEEFRVGACPRCGVLVVRKAPADLAVCKACYENPGCLVEVRLKTPAEFLRQIGERFFKNHKELEK